MSKDVTPEQYNAMMEEGFRFLQENEVAKFPCGGYDKGCTKMLTCKWSDELGTLIPVRNGESIQVYTSGQWCNMIVCDLCIHLVAKSGVQWRTVTE